MKEKLQRILRNISDGYKFEVHSYQDEEGTEHLMFVVENPDSVEVFDSGYTRNLNENNVVEVKSIL